MSKVVAILFIIYVSSEFAHLSLLSCWFLQAYQSCPFQRFNDIKEIKNYSQLSVLFPAWTTIMMVFHPNIELLAFNHHLTYGWTGPFICYVLQVQMWNVDECATKLEVNQSFTTSQYYRLLVSTYGRFGKERGNTVDHLKAFQWCVACSHIPWCTQQNYWDSCRNKTLGFAQHQLNPFYYPYEIIVVNSLLKFTLECCWVLLASLTLKNS